MDLHNLMRNTKTESAILYLDVLRKPLTNLSKLIKCNWYFVASAVQCITI